VMHRCLEKGTVGRSNTGGTESRLLCLRNVMPSCYEKLLGFAMVIPGWQNSRLRISSGSQADRDTSNRNDALSGSIAQREMPRF